MISVSKIIKIIFFTIAGLFPLSQLTGQQYEWELAWSDEFSYEGEIDDEKWFHQTQLPNGGSWFNGELQHYTNRIDNSFVTDDKLNIVAKKEVFSDQGQTKEYTSARLNSKFAFTYGRVDVRAILPSGDGTWPAIWMLGRNINEDGGYWDEAYGTTNWPAIGEIDIMEHWGNNPDIIHGSLHTTSSHGSTVNTSTIEVDNARTTFHVYSILWNKDEIQFLVDDHKYYTYSPEEKTNENWPFNSPQYLLLNIAMGGVGGEVDPNFSQSSMVIDYVRVYQLREVDEDEPDDTEVVLSSGHSQNPQAVYPNPTTRFLYIEGKDDSNIVLVSMTGKKYHKPLKNDKIDVSELPAGLYLLQSSKAENIRFIKK